MSTERQSLFEVLTYAECVALLDQELVGRLAWTTEYGPTIVPVNYAWDGQAIVIRSDPGMKQLALHQAQAAFEIDRIDRNRKEGWSVVIHGMADETPPNEWPTTARKPNELYLEPWAPGDKVHWIRIEPRTITGRRIRQVSELDTNPFWLLTNYMVPPHQPPAS